MIFEDKADDEEDIKSKAHNKWKMITTYIDTIPKVLNHLFKINITYS